MANRVRYGSSRFVNARRPRPIVHIVFDDTHTAPRYFEELERLVKTTVTLRLIGAPDHGSTPDQVLKCAIGHKKALQAQTAQDAEVDREFVWILIDTEAKEQSKSRALDVERKARDQGISAAVSCPCFEVWTLLHLLDTGQSFGGCDAVITALKREWLSKFRVEFRSKSQADYSKIIELRSAACANAAKHSRTKDPSWTEVHKLVEQIDQLASEPESA